MPTGFQEKRDIARQELISVYPPFVYTREKSR